MSKRFTESTSYFKVSAQTGTADTIYVDVPAEVEGLRMQTTECIAVGKKDKVVFNGFVLDKLDMEV